MTRPLRSLPTSAMLCFITQHATKLSNAIASGGAEEPPLYRKVGRKPKTLGQKEESFANGFLEKREDGKQST